MNAIKLLILFAVGQLSAIEEQDIIWTEKRATKNSERLDRHHKTVRTQQRATLEATSPYNQSPFKYSPTKKWSCPIKPNIRLDSHVDRTTAYDELLAERSVGLQLLSTPVPEASPSKRSGKKTVTWSEKRAIRVQEQNLRHKAATEYSPTFIDYSNDSRGESSEDSFENNNTCEPNWVNQRAAEAKTYLDHHNELVRARRHRQATASPRSPSRGLSWDEREPALKNLELRRKRAEQRRRDQQLTF